MDIAFELESNYFPSGGIERSNDMVTSLETPLTTKTTENRILPTTNIQNDP